jgi:hypothetical protein
MPRPTEITEEQIAKWDADLSPPDSKNDPFSDNDTRKEVGYAGSWLDEQLRAMGLNERQAYLASTAMGQVCVGRSDPWAVAQKVLELAKEGKLLQPGPQLANALLHGQLDDVFGPGGSLNKPGDIEKFMEILGVSSIEELVKKYNCNSVQEMREKLRAEIAAMEVDFAR